MGSNLIAGLYLNALKITRIVQLGWGFLSLISLLRLIHEISIELIHFSFPENLLPVRSVVPQGDTCDRKVNDPQTARKVVLHLIVLLLLLLCLLVHNLP